jgi:hypothetical protein
MRFLYRSLRFLSILYALRATFGASTKGTEESSWLTWMKAQSVAEGLHWPIASAISVVLLIAIGIAGEKMGPNTPQANVESPYLR